MNTERIKNELTKLNAAQRKALRVKFANRNITSLWVDAVTDHVTVEFNGKVTHSMYVGPRGAIRHHTYQESPR